MDGLLLALWWSPISDINFILINQPYNLNNKLVLFFHCWLNHVKHLNHVAYADNVEFFYYTGFLELQVKDVGLVGYVEWYGPFSTGWPNWPCLPFDHFELSDPWDQVTHNSLVSHMHMLMILTILNILKITTILTMLDLLTKFTILTMQYWPFQSCWSCQPSWPLVTLTKILSLMMMRSFCWFCGKNDESAISRFQLI